MRSLAFAKLLTIGALAVLASGCLVSETPILDQKNGRAKPLKAGDYMVCPLGDDAGEDDCESMKVSHDKAGLYTFLKADEKPAFFRFRRVARNGYAVQSAEGDDGYQYYYGRKHQGGRFDLTMMLCADLPEGLRASLIASSDLASEDDNFETCIVNSWKGLRMPARAYHRGEIASEESITLRLTPAEPSNASQ